MAEIALEKGSKYEQIGEVLPENTSLFDTSDISFYYKKKSKKDFAFYLEAVCKQVHIIIVGLLLGAFFLLLAAFNEDWREMGWKGWFSIAVTVLSLLVLIGDLLQPGYVFLSAMTLCYLFGIITSEEALEGFSNSGVITIGALFIVAKAVELSDILRYMVKYVLRYPKSLVVAQVRLLIPVAFLSAFINNTPIVAMMIPVVESWCNQCDFSPSHLMMPLSYAAILGGTCTVIGTSTNLIVVGLVQDQYPNFEVGFFEVGIVGIPIAILSILYMLLFSRFLLPSHQIDNSPDHSNPSHLREYSISFIVTKKSNFIGKTVEEKGMDKLRGVRIFKVVREGARIGQDEEKEVVISPVPSDLIIQQGDLIFFHGILNHLQVVFQLDGFVPGTVQIAKISGKRSDRVLLEVVLSNHSPLIGKTIRDSHFRSKYNAAILAVHRYGEQIESKLPIIVLKAGDTLLIESTITFIKYHKEDAEFALVSEISRGMSKTPRRISFSMLFVITLAIIMIIISAGQWIDLLPLSLAVGCCYVLAGNITWSQSISSIQGETLLIIASAFGLGNALQYSGAANVISNTLLNVFSIGGRMGVIGGLYAATALLSAVISNGATVTLMFPIALELSYSAGISIRCITFVLMMAASCCFMTPIGYQTNLMVMGPGSYSTWHYLKFGFPLTVLNLFVTVILSYYVWADDFVPAYSHDYQYLPPQ